MRKIGPDIRKLLVEMAPDKDQARLALRTQQVRERYGQVIRAVYREIADVMLAHTNNVYIMVKKEVPTLIVYVDESIYAADLNAQRELIKLMLLEKFGEEIEEFEIHVSRGRYKQHRAYDHGDAPARVAPLSLDGPEGRAVREVASAVEDQAVRASLEKAMTADLGLKKAEKVNSERESRKTRH